MTFCKLWDLTMDNDINIIHIQFVLGFLCEIDITYGVWFASLHLHVSQPSLRIFLHNRFYQLRGLCFQCLSWYLGSRLLEMTHIMDDDIKCIIAKVHINATSWHEHAHEIRSYKCMIIGYMDNVYMYRFFLIYVKVFYYKFAQMLMPIVFLFQGSMTSILIRVKVYVQIWAHLTTSIWVIGNWPMSLKTWLT
jgi:hypothetical protein